MCVSFCSVDSRRLPRVFDEPMTSEEDNAPVVELDDREAHVHTRATSPTDDIRSPVSTRLAKMELSPASIRPGTSPMHPRPRKSSSSLLPAEFLSEETVSVSFSPELPPEVSPPPRRSSCTAARRGKAINDKALSPHLFASSQSTPEPTGADLLFEVLSPVGGSAELAPNTDMRRK